MGTRRFFFALIFATSCAQKSADIPKSKILFGETIAQGFSHTLELTAEEIAAECHIVREGGNGPYPDRPLGVKERGTIEIRCPHDTYTERVGGTYCADVGVGKPYNRVRIVEKNPLGEKYGTEVVECFYEPDAPKQ